MLLWKLDGLDDGQAQRKLVDSETTLLGLIKHMAWLEPLCFVHYIGGADIEFPWSDEDPDADWRIEEEESVASISQLYVNAIGEANAAIAQASDLDVPGTKLDEPRSLRWVLVHMIEETARHLGHADILREQTDGATGYLPGD